jgi:nucleotide-binding universal stress UspA family protein
MLTKILCAIDGSDHAEKAAQWASVLAEKFGAELILLFVAPHRMAPPELRRMAETEHVVRPTTPAPPPVSPQPGLPSWSPEDLSQSAAASATIYQELGERLVEGARLRAADAGVAKVTGLVEDGDPAHRIVEIAQRESVDLIVMGRRGLGDLKGLLLGSVTHKVAQAARCACLTVE